MNTDDPIEEPIEELIERSSLGAQGARQLRNRTTAAELRRIRELRTAEAVLVLDRRGEPSAAQQLAMEYAARGDTAGLRALANARQSDNAESARALYLRADELGDTEASVALGIISEKAGDISAAAEFYQRAITGGNSRASSHLERLVSKFGERGIAIESVERQLRARPHPDQSRSNPFVDAELTRYSLWYKMLSKSEQLESRRWMPLNDLRMISNLSEVAAIVIDIRLVCSRYWADLAHGSPDFKTRCEDPVVHLLDDLLYPQRTGSHRRMTDLGATLTRLLRLMSLTQNSLRDRKKMEASTSEFIEQAQQWLQSWLVKAEAERGSISVSSDDDPSAWAHSEQFNAAVHADGLAVRIFPGTDTVRLAGLAALDRQIHTASNNIWEACHDMNGANLSAANLVGVPLAGVRWSARTRWPDGWRQVVRDQSIELRPGLFEINTDGRRLGAVRSAS